MNKKPGLCPLQPVTDLNLLFASFKLELHHLVKKQNHKVTELKKQFKLIFVCQLLRLVNILPSYYTRQTLTDGTKAILYGK